MSAPDQSPVVTTKLAVTRRRPRPRFDDFLLAAEQDPELGAALALVVVEQLSEEAQAVLAICSISGTSVSDLAHKMGAPYEVAWRHYRRARRQLRAAVDGEFECRSSALARVTRSWRESVA